jgi:malonate decarboxylase gamma subunit
MTPADILASLFPAGHAVRIGEDGLIAGSGTLADGPPGEQEAVVIGVARRAALGVEGALALAGHVLAALERGGKGPVLVLVDSDSQRMSRRDELLGLNEFLAHLAKCLVLADLRGRPTIGLLYGHTAAGAFIATALATRVLVALPGAEPAVMDLPSMARVTKLPLEVLQEKAKSTPVFAPGLDNLARTGAVLESWDPAAPLSEQLRALLARGLPERDTRAALGQERGGRPKAAEIAARVRELALRHG